MKTIYQIAVIPGDGIGGEVITEGIKCLNALSDLHGRLLFEFKMFPWGSDYFLKNGVMMPADGLA
ncbi:MAG: tartrate dehydrogenase, partial [Proteobacteria bacterium]|nr:tartrate dehydrogenase [Pseudomonadota bacterium]